MDSKFKKILITAVVVVLVGSVLHAFGVFGKKDAGTNETGDVTLAETQENGGATETGGDGSTLESETGEGSENESIQSTESGDQTGEAGDSSNNSGSGSEGTGDDIGSSDNNAGTGTEGNNGTGDTGNGGTTDNAGDSGNGGTTDNSGNSGNDGSGKKTSSTVSFPYTDSASGLTVTKVTSYDGIFLEDGSDSQISNVAVIILKNESGKDIEYAEIKLKSGKKTYTFDASGIKKGSTTVVQEKSAKEYKNKKFKSCSIAATEGSTFKMSKKKVQVTENENDGLDIKNISNKDIACVRVFYKFYSADDDAYVGGITYTAKITDLKAGDSITVSPSHYLTGESKVVMVRTYATADE